MVNQRKKDLIQLGLILLGIIVLNLLASRFFTRIDFTAEKRYTLSPISKDVLASIKEPIQITVYLEGDFPAGFRRLRAATADLLYDFKAYSGGTIDVEFVNPLNGDAEQEDRAVSQLLERGIEATNLNVKTEDGLSQKLIFPAALINSGNKSIAVKLLQNRKGPSYDEVLNNSIQNLEYAFISAIRKITAGDKARVGFSEGHGELNDYELSDALSSLADYYEVGRVNLDQITFEGLDKLDLLVIAKPLHPFSEVAKYKIDYFLTHGGRIIWAIDQVNADLDSLRKQPEHVAFARDLNLDDQLFKYGVRLNYDLLADMNAAQIPVNVGDVGGQAQIQLLPWLFYPILVPISTNPLVKNLDGIRTEFPGTIDIINIDGLSNEIVLSSSPYNRTLAVPVSLSLSMLNDEPNPDDFQSPKKAVAVAVAGKFPSAFQNRPAPEGIVLTQTRTTSKPSKMIVIADGDVFKNQLNPSDGSAYPLGFDRYTGEQYANNTLLLNAADYLLDDGDIIQLRNKEVRLRLLDRAKVKEEKNFWQFINIAVPLLVLIAYGIFQHYHRRRKYAR